jgi:hypothetical protein
MGVQSNVEVPTQVDNQLKEQVEPRTSDIKNALRSSAKRRKIVIHEDKKLPKNTYKITETPDGQTVLQEDISLEDN